MKVAYLMHNGRSCAVLWWECESFFERAAGLVGQTEPLDSQVLHIPNCNAIHTFGLRYPIDVIFTNTSGRVLHCVRRLAPRRLAIHRGAHAVLEMRAGLSSALGIEVGSSVAQARLRPLLPARPNAAQVRAAGSMRVRRQARSEHRTG